ncbi:carboxypeptidase regulatory-like domain-containing protein [Gimesia sp.]|uniref:carboxypeptidase regulatory-like domain-containing protein n=1 Tax=Gimesia sp. TaxID=2024833 RepID=UPI003A900340
MYYRLSLYSLLLVFTAGLTGCGGTTVAESLPDTAPVSGVVTLNGNPIMSATVTFVPMGTTKGIECVGVTDESGKYTLQQIRGAAGAPPGEYRVVINYFLKADGTPIKIDGSEPPANLGADEALPPMYSSFTDSKLTAKVTEAGGEFPFELKAK